jgi:hypothetical protein
LVRRPADDLADEPPELKDRCSRKLLIFGELGEGLQQASDRLPLLDQSVGFL